MKKIKLAVSVILAFCLMLCLLGCAETDEFEGFDPIGVRVVENVSGVTYQTDIDDKEYVDKLWNKFKRLDTDDYEDGEMGSSYIYMCFYDAEQTLAVFTMYNNGSCCLGEDFKTFYAIKNGVQAYLDFCEIHTEYLDTSGKTAEEIE